MQRTFTQQQPAAKAHILNKGNSEADNLTSGPFLVQHTFQKMQERSVTHSRTVQLSPTASHSEGLLDGSPTRCGLAQPGTKVHGYLMDVSTDASTGSVVPYRSCLCLLFQVPIHTWSLQSDLQTALVVLTSKRFEAMAAEHISCTACSSGVQHELRTLNKVMLRLVAKALQTLHALGAG